MKQMDKVWCPHCRPLDHLALVVGFEVVVLCQSIVKICNYNIELLVHSVIRQNSACCNEQSIVVPKLERSARDYVISRVYHGTTLDLGMCGSGHLWKSRECIGVTYVYQYFFAMVL